MSTRNVKAVSFTPEIKEIGYRGGEIGPNSIGLYIKAIYKYAIVIIALLAVVTMMFGGILWITAAGSPDRVTEAKSWIGSSITGLVLALLSYTILYNINKNLVNFKPISIDKINTQIACCSEFKGTIKGFPIEKDNRIEYTCSIPRDKKEEELKKSYGKVLRYYPEKGEDCIGFREKGKFIYQVAKPGDHGCCIMRKTSGNDHYPTCINCEYSHVKSAEKTLLDEMKSKGFINSVNEASFKFYNNRYCNNGTNSQFGSKCVR